MHSDFCIRVYHSHTLTGAGQSPTLIEYEPALGEFTCSFAPVTKSLVLVAIRPTPAFHIINKHYENSLSSQTM
jgi:hypothetical protein